MFNKAYYLEPEGAATKPYILLRDALSDSDRVAIVKVALRQREQLATLRVRDGVMVLNTMLWPDEIREPSFQFLDEKVEVREQELAMASSLIDSMTGEFHRRVQRPVPRRCKRSSMPVSVAARSFRARGGRRRPGVDLRLRCGRSGVRVPRAAKKDHRSSRRPSIRPFCRASRRR